MRTVSVKTVEPDPVSGLDLVVKEYVNVDISGDRTINLRDKQVLADKNLSLRKIAVSVRMNCLTIIKIRLKSEERKSLIVIKDNCRVCEKMKTQKTTGLHKIITCFLTLALILSGVSLLSVQAKASTSKTAEEAMKYVKSLKNSTEFDYDRSGSQECVDLIVAYYVYLGQARPTGNAVEYITNGGSTVPAGWQRIKGATPQFGDILLYDGSSSNPFGHVAIYESDYSTWHSKFAGVGKVQNITTIKYNEFTSNPYWGVIRPDFSGSSSQPTDGISFDGQSASSGMTNANIQTWVNSTGTLTQMGYYIGTSQNAMDKVIMNSASVQWTRFHLEYDINN